MSRMIKLWMRFLELKKLLLAGRANGNCRRQKALLHWCDVQILVKCQIWQG
jgi:hypothetical protein